MASREQILTLLEALQKATPSRFLQNIDDSSAGMQAILLYLAAGEENVTEA